MLRIHRLCILHNRATSVIQEGQRACSLSRQIALWEDLQQNHIVLFGNIERGSSLTESA